MNFLALLKHYQNGYTCVYEGEFSPEEIAYIKGTGVVVEDKQYFEDGSSETFTTKEGVTRLSVLFHTINDEKVYYKISVPALEKHCAGEACDISKAKKIILTKGLTPEELGILGKAVRNEDVSDEEVLKIRSWHFQNKVILKINF